MAKKVVVSPDEEDEIDNKESCKRARRKRSKCCTCCLVFLTVCLVLIAAIFGAGWYFGDKYAKEYFGLSLGDTFGVLNDFYWTKDDDVVTNPYNDKDLDGFYNEIKENMLLRTDIDVDFDEALKSALDAYLEQNKPETAGLKKSTTDGEEVGGNEIMDILIDMIAEVFTSDNIDKVRLAAYSEDNDEYIFELKDKQLAAFVNMFLKIALDGGIKMDMLDSVGEYIKLSEVVSLKQIKFKVQSKTDEQGVSYKAAAADLTVWIGLQKAAGQALTGLVEEQGFGWAGGLARGLGNMLLPKNFYATITVPLEEGATPAIRVNAMNAQKSENLYKIVDGVCKNIVKNDMTVDSLLGQVTEKIDPILDKLATTMDFASAGDGKVTLDLLGMLTDMVNGDSPDADPLTKADFMYMLQAVLTSDADKRLHDLEPYLYKQWYEGERGALVYKYDESVDVTGLTHVDYERKFIEEIKRVYPLKIADDASLSDVLALFGVSLGGEGGSGSGTTTDDILGAVDSDAFRESLYKSPERLKVTDRMLASMLSGELDSLISGGEGAIADMKIELDALSFIADKAHPTHKYALLAVSLDISEMLGSMGDDNALVKLATNVLPSKLLVSITIDITQSLAAGDGYTESQFMINDYEQTGRVLDTLKKFIPDFDLTAMTGDIEKMLRDMVLNLDEAIGIELVVSDPTATTVAPGALVMPDIFSVVADMVFDKDDDISPTALQTVLRGLVETDGFSDTPDVSSEDAFVERVIDLYYINDDGTIAGADDKFAALTEYLTDGADGFSSEKFRVKGTDPNVSYVAYDHRTIEELKPYMTGAELAGLIKNRLNDGTGGGADVSMFEVLGVQTSETELTVTLKVGMGDILPTEVKTLLGIDSIFVTAIVDVAHPAAGAYPVTVAINHMQQGSDEFDDLLKIIRSLDADFDIMTQVSEFGKILYEQLDSLKTSLGDDEFISFSDRGMEIAGFYEFLASKLIKTATGGERPDPETVKAAVQGMYEKPDIDGLDECDNNYVASDFIVNKPKAGDGFDIAAGTFTDRQFNANIQTLIARNPDVYAEQTIAIAGKDDSAVGDVSGAERYVLDWANAKIAGSPVRSDRDHLVVTFKMTTGSFSENGAGKEAEGFVPDWIYATVVLEKTADDEFTYVGTVFNNMDAEVYDLLLTLMGLDPSGDLNDPDKVNLKSITDDCLKGLNDLGKVTHIELGSLDTDMGSLDAPHGDGTATGIGSITYTPKLPIL